MRTQTSAFWTPARSESGLREPDLHGDHSWVNIWRREAAAFVYFSFVQHSVWGLFFQSKRYSVSISGLGWKLASAERLQRLGKNASLRGQCHHKEGMSADLAWTHA